MKHVTAVTLHAEQEKVAAGIPDMIKRPRQGMGGGARSSWWGRLCRSLLRMGEQKEMYTYLSYVGYTLYLIGMKQYIKAGARHCFVVLD